MIARVGLGLARPNRLLSRSSLRLVSTVKASHEQENEILLAQRKNRPVSPHLTIYKPQLTAVLSGLHRITGVAMAGSFYALTLGYAVSSLTGAFPLDSALITSTFASLPVVAKVGVKALMAYPFVFHVANGIRHLVWDFGAQLTIPGVYRTGYAVLGATTIFGTYLAFF
ncbi:succinate dehydrogenase [ubiquinone] cytochrome b subunit, mitochondrial [[Candida] anglica]|uniref:Succinate dehydrogenase [ubiquinone] cytochrome b subunit, mitochondrial n=1 Tax=[Candida] anglica TaxID=148631 RepID=A0ABP0E616_9ASCO